MNRGRQAALQNGSDDVDRMMEPGVQVRRRGSGPSYPAGTE